MTRPLLSVQTVAAQLGVSPKTIRGLVARGELDAHRVGTCIRIAPEAVDTYLASTRVGASARTPVPLRPPVQGRPGGLRAALALQDANKDGGR